VISRIEAYGYRCFPELSIDLGHYHVLAGANGAGKTTLLDIPALLGDLLRQQHIAMAFLERQSPGTPPRATSLTELLFKRMGDSIAFAVEAELPGDVVDVLADASLPRSPERTLTHLRYELRLTVGPRTLDIADEYLYLFSAQGVRPEPRVFPQGISESGSELREADWQAVILREGLSPTRFLHETTSQATDIPPLRVPPGQLALGTVPADPTLFPAALWFAQLLRQGLVRFEPNGELLRQPAPPGEAPRLLRSARNTPWLALRLSGTDPDRFASWVDHVRTALPHITAIDVIEREEDHYAYFSVECNGGYRVTSSGLSDGTLRILALTLLPYLDADVMPEILVTEEPETGIHPRAIETVVDSLSSLPETQVWISTHSPVVLAHTELADVLAARLGRDGAVSVIPGDEHPRLRDWQGSLDIGTLFAAGVLS
jgi:energy-coupling factor transporter ATP-binding protein EcfA2